MKKQLLLLLIAFVTISPLFAQIDQDNADWDKLLIKEVKLENPVYKPVIGVGIGTLAFYGEVENKYYKTFTYGNSALNVDIYRALDTRFQFGFRFLYGTLCGNRFDLDAKKNFNFQTQMMTFGSNLSYNFGHFAFIKNHEDRIITPYVSIGFEFLNFETFGDLRAVDGEDYNYWSDGSIRNMKESDDPTRTKSKVLVRDYSYETSLKERNIDKLSTTSPMSIGVPLELGVEFKISKKVEFKMGYAYHYTFTDNIDNITTKGTDYSKTPERVGDKKNDAFSYSYVQLSLDLFSKTTEEQQLQFLDLGAGGVFDFWDMDGDYVMDVYDLCPWTPAGIFVDTVGCPLDDDGDKVPNFADKEKDTPKNAFYVTTDGREQKEPVILALLNDNKALEQPDIYRHYPSLLEGTGLFRRFYKTIPEKFRSLDANKDDYISLDELLDAIDKFFDANSTMSVDDLYELNEFFFIQ